MENPDVPPKDHETLVTLADLSARHAGGRLPQSPELGWKMFLSRIAEFSKEEEARKRSIWPRQRRWNPIPTVAGLSIVAVLLLAVGGRISGLRFMTDGLTSSVPTSVYTTSNGERATIMLPDSTRVLLSVASRLEVPMDYGVKHRTIRLKGEALFTVRHHSSVPFTIHTTSSTTQVLGTSFAVRQYDGERTATVAVRDGKVKVHNTVLTAYQRVSATQEGTGPIQSADETHFLFEKGVLVLPQMSLADAIPELNRWYGADIRFAEPKVAHERIEGQFPTGSLADLIERLEWTFNLRAVRDGRTIIIYPRRT